MERGVVGWMRAWLAHYLTNTKFHNITLFFFLRDSFLFFSCCMRLSNSCGSICNLCGRLETRSERFGTCLDADQLRVRRSDLKRFDALGALALRERQLHPLQRRRLPGFRVGIEPREQLEVEVSNFGNSVTSAEKSLVLDVPDTRLRTRRQLQFFYLFQIQRRRVLSLCKTDGSGPETNQI